MAKLEFDRYGDENGPTVILLHGILGSRRNWKLFMKHFAQQNAGWQFLVVDLRHHGSSEKPTAGTNTLEDCAQDIVDLLSEQCIQPHQIWGHSFGGKVAMVLARLMTTPPRTIWVLDAIPGPSDVTGLNPSEQSVVSVIRHLLNVPLPIPSRNQLKDQLLDLGFSQSMAGWMTTNLEPTGTEQGGFTWRFNLNAIPEMLRSYGEFDCWTLVDQLSANVDFRFLRAQNSERWTPLVFADFKKRDKNQGLFLHTLEDSGHWVHVDNPQGLAQILKKSL